ncbi:MAG: hypothetical protein K8F30_09210 [Taibaiella sp.]|nr:hypothetical protein [Taibaiella sp.]
MTLTITYPSQVIEAAKVGEVTIKRDSAKVITAITNISRKTGRIVLKPSGRVKFVD